MNFLHTYLWKGYGYVPNTTLGYFLDIMEPPDELKKAPDGKEICPGCGNPFKSVWRHVARSKTCNGGQTDQKDTLQNTTKGLKRKLSDATVAKEKRKEQNKRYNQRHKAERQEKNKIYYQKNKAKRAESYNANTKCLQNFFKEIQHGPIFPCISCMRCLPVRSVSKLTEKFYQKLCEQNSEKYVCRDPNLQIHGNWYLCSTCYKNLSKGNLPSQCQENGLQLATVPDCLKISDVGNQLLAKNLIFVKVSRIEIGRNKFSYT